MVFSLASNLRFVQNLVDNYRFRTHVAYIIFLVHVWSLSMIAPGPIVTSWPKEFLRQPGIEPGSIAWEATMLTITPLTQRVIKLHDDVTLHFPHFSFVIIHSHTSDLQMHSWSKRNCDFFLVRHTTIIVFHVVLK